MNIENRTLYVTSHLAVTDLQREVRTVLESLLDKLTCLEKYEDYVEKLNIEAVKSQNSTNVVSSTKHQYRGAGLHQQPAPGRPPSKCPCYLWY